MDLVFRALFTCTFAAALGGQSFDVASIRPHDPDNSHFRVRLPNNGQFTAVGAPGKLLVMIAYGLQDSQILGGPSWFATEKWDIEAKCDDDRHNADETTQMLRRLLEERFSLKIHRDTELRPVYLLTVAKGGPKFKPSEAERTNIRPSANSFSIQRGNIAVVTGLLATSVGRPVLDRTDLTGLYDISVQWDEAPVREGGLPGTAPPDNPPGTDRGSIFTAIQDQLGLRLEPQRAPIDVIVVDAMERPSAN